MASNSTPTVPPPAQQVVLKHSEVMASALASKSRISGGGTWFSFAVFVLLCLAIWFSHAAAFWAVQQLPFAVMFAIGPWLPVILTAFLCLVAVKLALDFEQRRAVRAYLARLAANGAPLERVGTYEVTPQALVLTTERMVLAPRWHAIDVVERGAHGWVLSADQLHFLIPFADFPDEDAQRPLLAAITSRMTSEARARSRDAVEFAENQQGFRGHSEREAPSAAPVSEDAPASTLSEGGECPSAQGWLTTEQAGWAAGIVYGKVTHVGFHRWAYPFAWAVTGLIIGAVLSGLVVVVLPESLLARIPMLAFLSWLVFLLGGALGLAYGHKRLGMVADNAWRAGLEARGVPHQIEAEWRLTQTGVAFQTARFAAEAPYAAIHQVLHEQGYWILAADALALCIPDTAFASPESAHEFMARLLSRMSEPARARSVTVEGPVPSAS